MSTPKALTGPNLAFQLSAENLSNKNTENSREIHKKWKFVLFKRF